MQERSSESHLRGEADDTHTNRCSLPSDPDVLNREVHTMCLEPRRRSQRVEVMFFGVSTGTPVPRLRASGHVSRETLLTALLHATFCRIVIAVVLVFVPAPTAEFHVVTRVDLVPVDQ